MIRYLGLALVLLCLLTVCIGCGQVQEKDSGKVPTEVKEAERKDSTRLDSAATTAVPPAAAKDTTEHRRDSI